MKAFHRVLLGVWMVSVPYGIALAEVDTGIKLKTAGFAEGARDLGTGATDEDGNPIEETEEVYVDIYAQLHAQPTPDFGTFTRLQAFIPSGAVTFTEDDQATELTEYLALREFWIEYGGITTFPGEVLRLGLQRVREYDGLWWDRDIESVRWLFETTPLQAHIGVAERFATWRTDDTPLSPNQRDRAYLIGGVDRQTVPGHFVGIRGAAAIDHGETVDETTVVDEETKTKHRQLGWVGLHLHNGYYRYKDLPWVSYWAEAVAMGGQQEVASVDETGTSITEIRSEDVLAFGGDVGLRFRIADVLHLGGGAAYGQGGREEGMSNRFEQTGLHSNRSRFTGTRAIVERFNGALQADLSNLRVATAFVALPLQWIDANLIFNKFQRDDADSTITAHGIDVQPTVVGEHDIGDGLDAVLTWYFERFDRHYAWDEDLRTNVRLRGSVFRPGAAFGENVDDQHRVTLEFTLWL